MKNENVGVENLYLTPTETTDSNEIAPPDSFDSQHEEVLPVSKEIESSKKPTRIEEIFNKRGRNSKVFRMSDGTEQAVFSPSDIHVFDDVTHTFEDINNTLIEDEDGKHFSCGKNRFIAKFSREEDNDEIFSIEHGMHKVTVSARKNKKNSNKGIKPNLLKASKEEARFTDVLTFADIEPDTDYDYSVGGNGVKENIIVKKPTAVYRYPFVLKCEHVSLQYDEDAKRLAFVSNESGDEVFYIPAPFMTDANGASSTNINYEVKTSDNGYVHLAVIADTEWMNAPERAFPVAIDPQINISGSSNMSTFSWNAGTLSNASLHTIKTESVPGDSINGCTYSFNAGRMYFSLAMPTLPRNPRIKKAELQVFQASSVSEYEGNPLFGLYHVTDSIYTGYYTPANDADLIDYAKMRMSSDDGSVISYTFDITALVDMVSKNETNRFNLVLKLLEENTPHNGITLYGSSANSTYAPKVVITYESNYGVNTSYRAHTHELGRFGQGSVDLQCGNLMFESEDFAWAGNRMPVTIKHLFNSALSGVQYTSNDDISLSVADFSKMKVGNGFKLNIMQSIISASFIHEGVSCSGYVYVGENGEETRFKKNETTGKWEDVDGGNMLYDPVNRTLTQGGDTYQFDASGRLIRITDNVDNHMDITYASNRISSVTDGAGRVFVFTYFGDYLVSIKAPDETVVTYGYTDDLMTSITYPNGKKAVIAYSANKPASVTLQDSSNQVYKVSYTFNEDHLESITEYGSNDSVGATTTYSYSAASSRTLVTTTEKRDAEEGETADNVITTVYTFDDDGNIVSEYVYSTDTGNVGSNGGASGINPHSGDGGSSVVSNINNLLVGHNFETSNSWSELPNNCCSLDISLFSNQLFTKYGKSMLRMQFGNTDCGENGIYQVTNLLPKGQYTFSAYLRIIPSSDDSNTSAFLRVTDTAGNILGVSERLNKYDNELTRLILPFELESAQSVQVQVVVTGNGIALVDAAQLENNPYANAYNMLENGNFERETSGWTCSTGASSTTETCFNMSRSLCINGSVESDRYAYQDTIVNTVRSTRETFTLSGWAKANGLPNHDRDDVENAPRFRLRAEIKYSDYINKDYTTEEFTADFSPCTEDWQFASIQFSKSKYRIIEHVRVYCEYGYNSGTAYFDDIQLVRDSIETSLSASDFVVESGGDFDNEIGENTEVDTTPTFNEAKDDFGNALTETTFTDGDFGTIYRAFKFNEDTNPDTLIDDSGNNLIEETDASGNKTTYTVDGDTSRNEEVTDRLGNKTAYEYDNSGRTTMVTSKKADGTKLAHVSYAYDTFDNMTEIARGDGMKYALAYNEFHNLESIGIVGKDKKLIKYAYKNGNGRLKQMTYANGHTMKAVYNSIGRMVAEKWFETEEKAANSTETPIAHYKYAYDGSGNIVRSIDISGKKEYNYEYEEGKLIRATEADITLSGEIVTSKVIVNTVRYYYDNEGKLTKKVFTPANCSAQTVFYENNDDNTVVKFSAGDRTVTSHSKTDSFGRKVFDELQLGKDFVSRQFVYHAGKVTDEHKENEKVKSSPTTQLVSQIILSGGTTLSYGYDAEERITSVVETYTVNETTVTNTTLYTYDALGQLLTETVNGTVVNSMEYDNYGNILKKNGKVYTYGDVTWKDLLTRFDGKNIEYDAQGNPTSYLGHTLTWEKGRQLKSFDGNTYTYNANGIRTSKTVNDVKHEYTLNGTKILRETWNGNTLIPLYDNEDGVCGILYNNVPYYFIKNLQGDVIAIVNKDAETVARYSYDAWGVCTVTQDSVGIATINPFRYRGYYYDEEIDLYYLQSRYYDASVSRFIASDHADVTTCITVLHSHNLFCYACNSPVNETDSNGNLAAQAVAKFVLWAVFGVFAQFLSDVIESLYRKFIQKKNTSFTPSPLGDYLGSALAWGMCSLNLFNNKLAAFLAPFIPVLVKHVTNIIRGSFSWQALLVDLAAAFVAGIISVALNTSMKNKLSKVKRGKGNRYSDYSKYIKKQQKITFKINKTFLKVSVSIVIATSLIQLLLNLMLK